MRVDDGVHVRPMAVNPQMEAVGQVDHAVAFQQVQVVVHQCHVGRLRFVESEPETQHPVRAGLSPRAVIWPASADSWPSSAECGR
jgi:hypothetical protein